MISEKETKIIDVESEEITEGTENEPDFEDIEDLEFEDLLITEETLPVPVEFMMNGKNKRIVFEIKKTVSPHLITAAQDRANKKYKNTAKQLDLAIELWPHFVKKQPSWFKTKVYEPYKRDPKSVKLNGQVVILIFTTVYLAFINSEEYANSLEVLRKNSE